MSIVEHMHYFLYVKIRDVLHVTVNMCLHEVKSSEGVYWNFLLVLDIIYKASIFYSNSILMQIYSCLLTAKETVILN